MAALAEVAEQVMENEKHSGSEDTHSSPKQHLRLASTATRRRSVGYTSAPGSPAARTGPPNSFFFPLAPLPDTKGKRRAGTEGSHSDDKDMINRGSETPRVVFNEEDETSARLSDPYRNSFVRTESGFRSGWEYEDHDSTGRGTARLRDRQSWLNVEDWNVNPRKWLGLSEMDEQGDAGDCPPPQPPRQTDSPAPMGGPSLVPSRVPSPVPATNEELALPPSTPRVTTKVPRSFSLPYIRHNPAWNRIKSLIPHLTPAAEPVPEQPRSPRDRDVDIIDELTFSGLSVLMLRMWFERDERDEGRVPILLHRLKIRVSDSVNPLNNSSAVFRIECEYANSAAQWVIYRQLRDFNSLHRHYKVTNFYTRNMDLPDFPRAKLGRQNLHRLKREKGRELGKKEFAKMRREELENYLAGMIKAVRAKMFEANCNRLLRFLEVSALFITLARSGGYQLKAGVLKLEPAGSKKEYARKGTSWHDRRKGRWCAVRESYLVVMREAGELEIYDVFLLDSEFSIQRPRRYYRQGLRAMHFGESEEEDGILPEKHHRFRPKWHKHHDHDGGDSSGEAGHPRPDVPRVRVDGVNQGDTVNERHRPIENTRVQEHERSKSNLSHRSKDTARTGHSSVHTIASNIISRFKSVTSHKSRPSTSGRTTFSSSSTSSTSSDDESSDNDQQPSMDPSVSHPADMVYGGAGHSGEKSDAKAGVQEDEDEAQKEKKKKKRMKDVSRHTFYIENSQQRLKIVARSERQTQQWISALERMQRSSFWSGRNRFDSFAPIRLNVATQWLVDGRDYFWNLSRAISMAKKCIYIHGWWLTPELYMRRPRKENYRLDRLLKRKAEEGVMVYVIVYKEFSNKTTPTDSNYTKQRLIHLHDNIFVQRSPSHFATGTFYWAHHEKMCVIDETIAFMGGIDMCFGRWDTPQHSLVDEGEDGTEDSHIWIGKDYSNPRVLDFHTLNRPDQEMYDRSTVARMPWHDVGLQVVGQPARDLCRHFVQRWNFLLRLKNHSRKMPFIIPPSEFKPAELTHLGLTGTCEMQICRSAGPWSLGTVDRVEHSIQNAYLKAIQMSEHFVYIENQFFITSTTVGDTKIENKIGDALVNRIVRANRERAKWRACIVIPLLPGFTFPIDHDSASAIRLIVECQNRTISRGPHSIFSRLRAEGIDPNDYITFCSLRGWDKLPGGVLTTEQVYIHAKIMIVDDRLAIIGSANINERSQRGDRDSELAAVIRDTDMMDGYMGGEPFKVGRFAHTLRVRLMREHLGVDVDALYEEDIQHAQGQHQHAANPRQTDEPDSEPRAELDNGIDIGNHKWDPDQEQVDLTAAEQQNTADGGVSAIAPKDKVTRLADFGVQTVADAVTGAMEAASFARTRALQNIGAKPLIADRLAESRSLWDERQTYNEAGEKEQGFTSPVVPTVEEKVISEQQSDTADENAGLGLNPPQSEETQARTSESKELYGAPAGTTKGDDVQPHARFDRHEGGDNEKGAVRARSTLRKQLSVKVNNKQWAMPTSAPFIDPHGFDDPVCDEFFEHVWLAAAVRNTEIYRKVFHAIPDDLVTTWKQYKDFVAHHERLQKPAKDETKEATVGRVPSEGCNSELGINMSDQDTKNTAELQLGKNPDENVHDHHLAAEGAPGPSKSQQSLLSPRDRAKSPPLDKEDAYVGVEPVASNPTPSSDTRSTPDLRAQPKEKEKDQGKKKPAGPNEPFEQWERDEMEALLNEVQGHLVIYSTRFLEGEDVADNFLFNTDRLLPLPIYN